MKSAWLHRCALLLALMALIVIAMGALLTSQIRPFSGATAANVSAPSLEQAHRIAGYVLAILTLGLAIWTRSLAGWIALAAVIVESLSAGVPVVHAFDAQVFFALVAAIAVLTSESWQAPPEPVECQWKPLRPLGMTMVVLVFLQIGLGAAFRHSSMSVIWHILDAMIVLLVILVTGVFVLREYPEHPTLHPAALALVILTGVQVMLGFTVYMVLLISSGNNTGLIITSVLHVVNGSLTLAASVALAMQMQRNLIQLSGV